MSRFFGGYGGGGGGSRGGSGGDSNGTFGKSLAANKSKSLKSGADASPEDQYQKLIAQKMESHKQQIMKQKKYGHTLKNADANVTMSKGAMHAMEIMAAKMAKREMKKKKPIEAFEIKPMYLGGVYGGRIDAQGNVWSAQNKKVLVIDKKTGAMKTAGFFAKNIGKFDPKSHACFLKIEKQMEAHALKNGGGGGSIWGSGGGASGGGGNIHESKGWW
jgi:hypothetical protein